MLLALSTAQKFSTGSITFLIGISITFFVLIIIIAFIMLLDYFLNKVNYSKLFAKKDKLQPKIDAKAQDLEQKEIVVSSESSAAITLVVKELMSKSEPTPHERYKIVSIKKIVKGDA